MDVNANTGLITGASRPRRGAANIAAVMAYNAQEARGEMLADLATATDEIGIALTALGDAFELLDDHTAEVLESELFRPVQLAYGRAQRTHSEFAARHGLEGRAFAPGSAGPPSQGARGFLDRAATALQTADLTLSTLQDSLRPVEVGDPELRAGLSEVRRTIADLPARAARLVRTLGR
jgi:hypothetical protein